MINTNNFFIDFETIGYYSVDNTVIDCSYCVIDSTNFINNPYSFQSLLQNNIKTSKLSVADQVKQYGTKIKSSDLQFWQDQPEYIRSKIKPSKDDLTVQQFVNQLITYLDNYSKIEYWWSRSNAFDSVILSRLFETQQKRLVLDQYLRYWRLRDTRTFIDAKLNFTTKNGFIPVSDVDYWNNTFTVHDSSHDLAADILRIQAIIRAENDLSVLER